MTTTGSHHANPPLGPEAGGVPTATDAHRIDLSVVPEFFDWNCVTDRLLYSPGIPVLLGCSSETAPDTGQTFLDQLAPTDRERLIHLRHSLTAAAPTYTTRFSITPPSTDTVLLEEQGCAFFDAIGQPLRIIGTLAKVPSPALPSSTQQAVQEARSRTEEEQQKYSFVILETVDSGFWMVDPEGRLLEVNDAYCQMSGYSRDELLRMHLWELEASQDSSSVREHIRRIRERGNDQFESRHRRKNGTFFDVDIRTTWMETEGGRIVGLCWDISERKAMEQALRENEERLRLALHGAKAGVWSWDLHTGASVWSLENFDLYGIDPAQGAPNYNEWKSCLHPDDRSTVERAIRTALDQRVPEQRTGVLRILRPAFERRAPEFRAEYRILHPQYGMRWLLAIGRIERTPDGSPLRLSGLNLDITERKRVEEALMESERCWRELAEAMPQLVWTANNEGMVDYYNRRHEEFSDPHPHTIIPWHPVLHPDDRWRTTEAWRRSVQTGNPYEVEHRVQRSDGTFRWYLTRAVPVHDAIGQVVKWYGTSTDVDDRRQAEEALRTADRRKDEFLAMLAHELRNPLAPIRNAVHIMSLIDLPDPKLKWVREVIDRQVRHLARLVDDLLDISRIVRGKITLRKERVELAYLVQQAQESARPVIEARKHRLTVKLPPYPVTLEGDAVRLSQALQNLLDNAAKYTREGGEIELTATVSRRELVISVRDNGTGIPPDLLPRVFDLFQQGERSLDRSQGGLGIGLTLVQQMVKLHGGQVTAQSAGLGQGSTFTIHLPLPDSLPLNTTTESRAPNRSNGGVRILVVEDDVVVAETTVLWLTMEGYEVRVAHTGEAALEQVLPFQPQVVLLDIGLPGMDGYTTARRLRALPDGEDLCLVAVTGYGHEEAQIRSREAGFDYHLVKPVDPAALSNLLATLGGEPPVTTINHNHIEKDDGSIRINTHLPPTDSN
ncbi:Histidine kinase [Gammaproteobacteria bacterium]